MAWQGIEAPKTNDRISGCTVLLLIEKWIKLIPKTIGNRKGDSCVCYVVCTKNPNRGQWIAQFGVLFFTRTVRHVGVLNFRNSSALSSMAKRSCYPQAIFASLPVGSKACTCVFDSLYSPWDDALPHWCCPSLQLVVYLWEMGCISDVFRVTCWTERKTSKMQHFWSVTHLYPATHAAKASFTAILSVCTPLSESGRSIKATRRRTVNGRAFFLSAKGVSLRDSPSISFWNWEGISDRNPARSYHKFVICLQT